MSGTSPIHARMTKVPVGKLLAPTILGLSCATAYWLGGLTKNANTLDEGLVVAQTALDLGDVWESSRCSHTLPITNASSKPIEIMHLASSCNCLSIVPQSLVLEPGQTSKLDLTLDLTPRTAQEASQSRRVFAVDVIPYVRDSVVRPAAWTIRGRVRSAITLTPRALDLGDSLVRGRPPVPHVLDVTAHVALAQLVVTGERSLVDIAVSRPLKRAPHRFQLHVTGRPSLAAGPFETNLSIKPLGADGKTYPPLTLAVRGRVREDVETVPPLLLIGARPVGDTVRETITLTSCSGRSFDVEAVDSGPSGPDLAVQPLHRDSPAQARFWIHLRVAKERHQVKTLRFLVRLRDRNLIVALVKICYFGTCPNRSRE